MIGLAWRPGPKGTLTDRLRWDFQLYEEEEDMAFTNSVVNRFMQAGGVIVEQGTWTLTGGSTTGVITPATNGQGINNAGIFEIYQPMVTSDTNSAALVDNLATNRKTLRVTSAANDTGTYTLVGRVA